jgi:hypothetical protein
MPELMRASQRVAWFASHNAKQQLPWMPTPSQILEWLVWTNGFVAIIMP